MSTERLPDFFKSVEGVLVPGGDWVEAIRAARRRDNPDSSKMNLLGAAMAYETVQRGLGEVSWQSFRHEAEPPLKAREIVNLVHGFNGAATVFGAVAERVIPNEVIHGGVDV